MEPQKIESPEDLEALRAQYRIAADWHEPDEHDIYGILHGTSLGTAGFWPRESEQERRDKITELYVTLQHEGQPIAYVNIALLLQWACQRGADLASRDGA